MSGKVYFYFLLLLVVLQSCTSQDRQQEFNRWIEKNDKVKVLSTTRMIDDLVKQIGDGYIDSLTLIDGELDPHSYQLVKGDDEKLKYAELIFYSGLGLEHGPSLHQALIKNPKAFGLGDLITKNDPKAQIYVNGQKDPHIWMDISLWQKAVPFIVQALSQRDPEHAQIYAANGVKLQQEMMTVHEQVKGLLHQIPEQERYLVTSHDAFNYFTRAYLSEDGEIENGSWEKRFAAPEGLAPESQLSTSDIKFIIDHLKKHQIHLIFPESNVSQDSIKKIVQAGKEQGLDVKIACCPLYGDAMGPANSDGDTYLKMILHNAKMLTTHMDHHSHQQKVERS